MTQIYKVCVVCTFQKVLWCEEKGCRWGFGHQEDHRATSPWPTLNGHDLLDLVSPCVNFGNNFYPANPTDSLGIKWENGCSSTLQKDGDYANVRGYWRETLHWGQGDSSTTHVSSQESVCQGFEWMQNWSRDIHLPHFWLFFFFLVFFLLLPLNLNKTSLMGKEMLNPSTPLNTQIDSWSLRMTSAPGKIISYCSKSAPPPAGQRGKK